MEALGFVIGIMEMSLGVMWFTTELLHRSKNSEAKSDLTVIGVLKKVDVPTIFFFLGILLAVAHNKFSMIKFFLRITSTHSTICF